jgi:hypothetical protein
MRKLQGLHPKTGQKPGFSACISADKTSIPNHLAKIAISFYNDEFRVKFGLSNQTSFIIFK